MSGSQIKVQQKPQMDLGSSSLDHQPSTRISRAGLYTATMSRFLEAFSRCIRIWGGFPFQINAPVLTPLCLSWLN